MVSRLDSERLAVLLARFTTYPPPLSSQYATYHTVKARFWPWLSGESPFKLLHARWDATMERGWTVQEEWLAMLRARWQRKPQPLPSEEGTT